MPKDIQSARSIKVLFTGDLERTIYTNPFFTGKEKNYLRAQIARISFATSLAPAGVFKREDAEDARPVDLREIADNAPEEGDMVMPSTKAVSDISMWVHHTTSILNMCKLAHVEIAEAPAEDPEADLDKLNADMVAADPYELRLKPIAEDNPVIVGKNTKICPWVVK